MCCIWILSPPQTTVGLSLHKPRKALKGLGGSNKQGPELRPTTSLWSPADSVLLWQPGPGLAHAHCPATTRFSWAGDLLYTV